MSTLVTILHVLVCIFLMLTVLLQAGKGGGMGAAFGGGSSSGTVFGGAGAGNFLRRLTVGAAVVFMLTSMTLAYLASSTGADSLKSYELTQKKEANAKRAEHERIVGGDAGLADEEGAEGEEAEGADLIDELDPETEDELGLDEAATDAEGDDGAAAIDAEGDDEAAGDAESGDEGTGEGAGGGEADAPAPAGDNPAEDTDPADDTGAPETPPAP